MSPYIKKPYPANPIDETTHSPSIWALEIMIPTISPPLNNPDMISSIYEGVSPSEFRPADWKEYNMNLLDRVREIIHPHTIETDPQDNILQFRTDHVIFPHYRTRDKKGNLTLGRSMYLCSHGTLKFLWEYCKMSSDERKENFRQIKVRSISPLFILAGWEGVVGWKNG